MSTQSSPERGLSVIAALGTVKHKGFAQRGLTGSSCSVRYLEGRRGFSLYWKTGYLNFKGETAKNKQFQVSAFV